ncbi:hypothetical protein HDU93_008098 [Gonapodya sp. JEL0774]|nr:hypothetical protein HDU93_008098 [Gonapodya sp. JEL0774]
MDSNSSADETLWEAWQLIPEANRESFDSFLLDIVRECVCSVDYLTVQTSLLKQPEVRFALEWTAEAGCLRGLELHNINLTTVDHATALLSSVLPHLQSLSINFGKFTAKEQFHKLIYLNESDTDIELRYNTLSSLTLVSTSIPEPSVSLLAKLVNNLQNLRVLRLHDCELSEPDLNRVLVNAPASTLKVLDIAHCTVGSSAGGALGSLLRRSTALVQLRLVDLHEERSMINLSFWQFVFDGLVLNQSIERLEFAQVPLGHNHLIQLGTALGSHSKLRTLIINSCYQGRGFYYDRLAMDHFWEKLAQRADHTWLIDEVVFLDCLWTPETVPSVRTFLQAPNTGLQHLRLSFKSSSTLTETCTALLAAVASATPTLHSLSLEHSHVTDQMVMPLIESISDGRMVYRILKSGQNVLPANGASSPSVRDQGARENIKARDPERRPTFTVDLSGNQLTSRTLHSLITAWGDFRALPIPSDLADLPTRERTALLRVYIRGANLLKEDYEAVDNFNEVNGHLEVGCMIEAGHIPSRLRAVALGNADGFDEM